LALLDAHTGEDAKERVDLEGMRAQARRLAQPFSRAQPEAHFTGSAVVVDPSFERVCLVHHAKLHRWLQPGGHVDDADGGALEETALREAREETGLSVRLHPQGPLPLDVDCHEIPQRKTEAAHHHLDVRFLLVADNPDALVHDPQESFGAQWLPWDDALERVDDEALKRLLRKSRRICQGA